MATLGLQTQGKPYAAVSSNPAANAEASITVPTGSTWLVVSAHITCAQGLTQTPLPSLVISDASSNVLGSYPGASAAQSVSTTATYDWFEGATLTAGAGATANKAPLPRGVVVKGGWTIATSTAGKGANTDLSALTVHAIKL